MSSDASAPDLTAYLQAMRLQARLCAEFGSPFSAAVLDAIAADIERGGPYAALADGWTGADVPALMSGAVPLRLLGALHHLVLTDSDAALAAVYPDAEGPGDAASVADLLAPVLERHRPVFAAFMASPPQTNEVRRSLCLVGGFLAVAKRFGLPLRCLEIGASAGLNMNWDRFHYDFGGQGGWGDPASALQLDGDWSGPAPAIDAHVRVAEKRACDQAPIDVRDEDQASRLQAYVWPDQPDRLARLKAAIAIARQTGVSVDKADAADWVKANLAPKAGVATVLYHSVFWTYLPQATAEAIVAHVEKMGESATADAPLAWLRMELGDSAGQMEVRLKFWPGGDDILLARVHPHGAKVSWAAD